MHTCTERNVRWKCYSFIVRSHYLKHFSCKVTDLGQWSEDIAFCSILYKSRFWATQKNDVEIISREVRQLEPIFLYETTVNRDSLGRFLVENERTIKLTWIFVLHVLHTCTEEMMEPLAELPLYCFQTTWSDVFRLREHSKLASYASDIPEVENFLSLKQKAAKMSPWQRYLLHREDLAHLHCGAARSIFITMKIMEKWLKLWESTIRRSICNVSFASSAAWLSTR